ncbi:MAG: hypothetical protein GDA53_10215 [Rhodobacteraceae bacterium]|nr:hypothetical protein [Paracoccaceae bacterium]
MRDFDALPSPLRTWLSQAALPWSAGSARRIWLKARARGLTPEETLVILNRVEARTLAHDVHLSVFKRNIHT